MSNIDYQSIYDKNRHGWYEMTENPQKYEALLAGHYSDSNHFVYELLQNAEDAQATKVVFEYYPDRLVFYHDGKPFDEKDVQGVSSMLMGTKNKDDGQTIGRFGMGFKSVFKYTFQPEIYSDKESFRIENFLLPVQIEEKWKYRQEMLTLIYEMTDNRRICLFENSEHLTKFVIPFAKKDNEGKIIKITGENVLEKLLNIEQEILLFLTNIKSLFWIDKTTDKYALVSLDEHADDDKLITCRIEGSDYGEKEEKTSYLKFTRKFQHEQMQDAEVSVAYKLIGRLNIIKEIEDSNVWVYFPTKDVTKLPFLIHGTFETAVSREKLMAPSQFNAGLFQQLEKLISDSLCDLCDRKLITQNFIRKIIIPAFTDRTMAGLKENITQRFSENALLPDIKGNYNLPHETSIAVPFGIADFFNEAMFRESFEGVKPFVVFNSERDANFLEYYTWLKDDLDVPRFTLESWAKNLSLAEAINSVTTNSETETLNKFYKFLSKNRAEVLLYNRIYARRSAYELDIRNRQEETWELLRTAPIVLNARNKLVPAFRDGKIKLYLNSSSDYQSVIADSIVNKSIAEEFSELLTSGLKIEEFNNYQFVKEKIINKYINIDAGIGLEEHQNYENDYFEDIGQIFKVMEELNNLTIVKELLENASIIAVIKTNGLRAFVRPLEAYIDKSTEGIDLTSYFSEIGSKLKYYPIDIEFYKNHGIAAPKLKQLGVISSPVEEGDRENIKNKYGKPYWIALSNYCPKIKIIGLIENFIYINMNPHCESSRKKSAEILKLLLSISDKLKGEIRYRKSNPEVHCEMAEFYKNTMHRRWLYDKNGDLAFVSDLSKYDLNPSIYGEPIKDREVYNQLGFIETEKDIREDALDMVAVLDENSKAAILNQLAKELGMLVSAAPAYRKQTEEVEDDFDLNELISNEFPVKSLRNKERLIAHIKQQFFCADPITYRQVWRQIRVSKNHRIVRAYAMGMYTNESDVKICQMCKQPIEQAEVVEIANFSIELEQLNLCLCRNCAGTYKLLKDKRKDEFKEKMKSAIKELDVESDVPEYMIEINSGMYLHFTQVHIAEIQAIFSLIDEHGLPNIDNENFEMVDDNLFAELYYSDTL